MDKELAETQMELLNNKFKKIIKKTRTKNGMSFFNLINNLKIAILT